MREIAEDLLIEAFGALAAIPLSDTIRGPLAMIVACSVMSERERCLGCQPSTAENPNEDAYQRGRFDGIMEFARAIAASPQTNPVATADSKKDE